MFELVPVKQEGKSLEWYDSVKPRGWSETEL